MSADPRLQERSTMCEAIHGQPLLRTIYFALAQAACILGSFLAFLLRFFHLWMQGNRYARLLTVIHRYFLRCQDSMLDTYVLLMAILFCSSSSLYGHCICQCMAIFMHVAIAKNGRYGCVSKNRLRTSYLENGKVDRCADRVAVDRRSLTAVRFCVALRRITQACRRREARVVAHVVAKG